MLHLSSLLFYVNIKPREYFVDIIVITNNQKSTTLDLSIDASGGTTLYGHNKICIFFPIEIVLRQCFAAECESFSFVTGHMSFVWPVYQHSYHFTVWSILRKSQIKKKKKNWNKMIHLGFPYCWFDNFIFICGIVYINYFYSQRCMMIMNNQL